MKAFILDRFGKDEQLRLGDVPEPSPGPDDILVKVQAAGLNQLDAKIASGAFKAILPYRLPLVLGHDVAGKVIAVGENVTKFTVGDEVYARPRDGRIGGFAECIAIDAADAALKPANLSMVEAASLPLVALTAWQVLVNLAQVRAGQKVLIHAGSGGVGTIAIQLAKTLGAQVATTTSAANTGLARQLGADIAIDYRSQAFEKKLSGYDVVLNSLDTNTLERSLEVLKTGGRLISISGPPDPAFAKEQRLGSVLRLVLRLLSSRIRRKARKAGVHYSFLFMNANGAELAELASLIEAGTLRPVVDRTYPFEQLNDAFAYLATGRERGKVVVVFDQD